MKNLVTKSTTEIVKPINVKALNLIKSDTVKSRINDLNQLLDLNRPVKDLEKPLVNLLLEQKELLKDGAYKSLYFGLKKYLLNATDSIEERKLLNEVLNNSDLKPNEQGYNIKQIPTEKDIELAIRLNRPIGLIIKFLANTGLRISELIAIEKSNITYNGCCHIKYIVSKKRRPISMVLDLPTNFVKEIEACFGGEKYLFETKGHKAYNRVNLTKQIETLLGCSAHSLRHFFASRVYKETKDIKRVKELLNHSTLDVTDNYLKALNKASYIESFKDFN